MNLILDQLRADVRRSRGWLVGLWALCGLQLVLAYSTWPARQTFVLEFMLAVLYGFLVAIVLIRLMHADPWVGTDAWWMTRPIRRFHLFIARAAFAFGLIVLPQMMLQALFAVWHGFTAAQLVQAAIEVLLYSTVVIATIGAVAALSRTLVELAVVTILGGLTLTLSATLLDILQRFQVLPRDTWQIVTETQAASVVVATLLVYTLTVLGTWGCQARTGRRTWSALLLATGLAATVVVTGYWRHDSFGQPLEMSGNVRLLPNDAAPPAAGPDRPECSLWGALRIDGLASNQFVTVRGVRGTLDTTEHGLLTVGQTEYDINRRWAFLSPEDWTDYFRVVRRTFPSQTVWRGRTVAQGRRLNLQGVPRELPWEPLRGVLTAQLVVDSYAVEKSADVPLRPESTALLAGQQLRVLRITPDAEGVTVRLWHSIPSLLFGREDWTRSRLFPFSFHTEYLTEYVIYHPDLQEAFLVEGTVTSRPSVLGQSMRTERVIRIRYPALRARLTGVTAAEWVKDARLVVFRPRYGGAGNLNVERAQVTLAPQAIRYSTPAPRPASANSQE